MPTDPPEEERCPTCGGTVKEPGLVDPYYNGIGSPLLTHPCTNPFHDPPEENTPAPTQRWIIAKNKASGFEGVDGPDTEAIEVVPVTQREGTGERWSRVFNLPCSELRYEVPPLSRGDFVWVPEADEDLERALSALEGEVAAAGGRTGGH
jgi:hypothetical protein